MRKFKTKRGKEVTLLNPAEKGRKYASELKNGQRYTNQGELKVDKDSNPMSLSREQRAYRSGYLDSRKDSARCWRAKNR